MKQQTKQHRRAICLLLTAAALPFTPLAAQEAQPVPEPFAVEVAPPPVVVTPVEAPAPEPAVTDPAPAPTATTPPAAQAPAARRAGPMRPAARAAPRATVQTRAAAPVRQAQPAPAAPVESAPADAAPAAALPPAGSPAAAIPPVVLPPAETAPPAEESGTASILPWLIGGALLLGALALFFLLRRRRRTGDELVEREETVEDAPLAAAAPLAATGDRAEPAMAGAAESGRPWLDLHMRPVRAGVTGQDAVVEFELSVDNQGSAPARDVRISTWMFAAGSGGESEMERALIEGSGDSSLPTIGAGDGERIEKSVALPTAGLDDDSVLPVVVAEARYRLPDGSEGRTAASFAIGVPDGEELAHFAIDNPSGFHDDVEARQMGEVERA